MAAPDTFQKYLLEEFYDDYREGHITRRTFIRRAAFIMGSMSATITALTAVGCSPAELPTATEAMPVPTTPATLAATAGATAGAAGPTAGPTTGPRSPLSVAADDAAVQAGDVTFASQGTDITGYLARPAGDGKYPVVLIAHENRGLTPHIQDVARRYAKEGYVALALDLLSREGGTASRDRDEIPGLLTGAGAERHVGDFQAAYDYVQTLPYADGQNVAMTGFCFGGGIAWRAAAAIPGLKAVAPFYGPAPDEADVAKIKAAALGVYAEQDERITGGKDALDKALTAAGVTHQMNVYPGVNHAFHNDTGDRYNEEQATAAWNDTLAWFKAHMATTQ
jgi:carboxymethylenebutenolidase